MIIEMEKYYNFTAEEFKLALGIKQDEVLTSVYLDSNEKIRERLFQQKLSEEYQKWIDEIKAKAKVYYLVNF